MHRLKGELLLKQVIADEEQAEACFQQALTIARHQQAKSWSCAPPPAWLACGSARASALMPMSCWHRSTAGSPRALTPPIFRRLRRCWRIWGIAQEKIAVRYSIIAHILTISEV